MVDRGKSILLFLNDFLNFYIALFFALLLRHLSNFNLEIYKSHIFPFFIIFIFWFFVFQIFDLYNLKKINSLKEYTENYFSATVISIFITVFIFYAIPFFKITPKIVLLIFILIFLPLNLILRELIKNIKPKRQQIFILIGNNRDIDEIEKFLSSGFLSTKKIIRYKRIEELLENNFDYLIIPDDLLKEKELSQNLLNKFFENKNVLPISVFQENFLNKISIENLSEDVILKSILNKNEAYDIIKEILEKIIAVLALIISLPLWPIIILGIKISSPGPIFFKDTRIGEKEKKFILYKFRTMHSEDYKNPEKENVFGVKEGDKRVFWFGKILRKLHLDELPQLINVIKGDISIVGPRPDSEVYYNFLKDNIPFYRFRTFVKPGITGWAQINKKSGDSLEEAKERLEYDLYYLKNKNLILDLIIIIKSFKIIVTLWGK